MKRPSSFAGSRAYMMVVVLEFYDPVTIFAAVHKLLGEHTFSDKGQCSDLDFRFEEHSCSSL